MHRVNSNKIPSRRLLYTYGPRQGALLCIHGLACQERRVAQSYRWRAYHEQRASQHWRSGGARTHEAGRAAGDELIHHAQDVVRQPGEHVVYEVLQKHHLLRLRIRSGSESGQGYKQGSGTVNLHSGSGLYVGSG